MSPAACPACERDCHCIVCGEPCTTPCFVDGSRGGYPHDYRAAHLFAPFDPAVLTWALGMLELSAGAT